MRFYYYILIILVFGCYKKHQDIEAIPIEDMPFKTTLKNHTPGIDYVINKSLEVKNELIIEEGVEIIIGEGCEIRVTDSGSIHVNGSEKHPIVFKSKDNSGRWKGIIIYSSGDNQMLHAEIEGAGSGGDNHGALEVRPFGNILLKQCKIKDNGDASGILLAENAKCVMEDCELRNNNFPIQMDLHAVLNSVRGDMKTNKHNAIKVKNHDGSPLVTKTNLQLNNPGLAYYMTSWLIITNKKLTVNNGVTVLFEANTGIVTNGGLPGMNTGLVVNGTGNSPVTFGSFSEESNRKWAGVNLTAGNNLIQYAKFNSCNSTNKDIAVMNVSGYAVVDCKNSTFYSAKSFCNISLIGKNITFNGDIFTKNTFVNSLLPCVII
jgi:hypothetical protein